MGNTESNPSSFPDIILHNEYDEEHLPYPEYSPYFAQHPHYSHHRRRSSSTTITSTNQTTKTTNRQRRRKILNKIYKCPLQILRPCGVINTTQILFPPAPFSPFGGIGMNAGNVPQTFDGMVNIDEPPLYGLVRMGATCDWTSVRMRLDTIQRSARVLSVLDGAEEEMVKKGKSEEDEVVGSWKRKEGKRRRRRKRRRWSVCSSKAPPRPFWEEEEMMDGVSSYDVRQAEYHMRELFWRHPTTGITSFHVAVCWNPPSDVVKKFLSINNPATAPKNKTKNNRRCCSRLKSAVGATPLHYACSNACTVETLRLLLDSIDEDDLCAYTTTRTTDSGFTALHCAANGGSSLEVMRVLLEIEPRAVTIRDADGCTPLDVLCRNQHDSIRCVLRYLTSKKRRLSHRRRRDEDDNDDDEDSKIQERLSHVLADAESPTWSTWFATDIHLSASDFISKAALLIDTARSIAPLVGGTDCIVAESDILHAAVSIPPSLGLCPRSLLEMIILLVPEELQRPIGTHGMLPLHLAACASASSYPLTNDDQNEEDKTNKEDDSDSLTEHSVSTVSFSISAHTPSVTSSDLPPPSTSEVILDVLLQYNPEAITIKDANGHLPLDVAIRQMRTVDFEEHNQHGSATVAMMKLLRENTDAVVRLGVVDELLYPHLLSKVGRGNETTRGDGIEEEDEKEEQENQQLELERSEDLNALYSIFRSRPDLVSV